jgi:acyl carrier protein
MNAKISEARLSQIRQSFISLCHDSGILTADHVEDIFHDDLIESGIIDSMGLVCLQDQIKTHYRLSISREQLIAELHTLEKLVNFLAINSTPELAV